MDRAKAKQDTIQIHDQESQRFPSKNDFSYTITDKDGVIWTVLWSRDVNVQNPIWHVSVVEKR